MGGQIGILPVEVDLMAGIADVKAASDITSVIGTRITLQKSGANFRALCPFHSEKSPSFFVSESMQRYKCFGCGETGDVFTFLEKYEGLTFVEALRELADAAGLKLDSFQMDSESQLRDQLLEILELAAHYYSYVLNTHQAGEAARTYLRERGVTASSVKLYRLGFALEQWDGLITYLVQKKKIDPALVVQAGLAIAGRSRSYDRFRGRIMFPLKNSRGQVVGFSGRLLQPTGVASILTGATSVPASLSQDTRNRPASKQSVPNRPHASLAIPNSEHSLEAKYINTPETVLYHKGQMLYGYSEHLQLIRQANEVVLVEGEFDVISSAQGHVNAVCGLKGSALTVDHVKLLSRTVDKIILCLDADMAGINATKRAIAVLQQAGMSRERPLELRVVALQGGKDPDELARKAPLEWRAVIKASQPAVEYLVRQSFATHDIQTVEGKTQVMYELTPLIMGLEHEIEKEHYLQFCAQWLGVTKSVLLKDMTALANKKTLKSPKGLSTSPAPTSAPLSRTQLLELFSLFLWTRCSAQEFSTTTHELLNMSISIPKAELILKRASEYLAIVAQPTLTQFNATLPEDLAVTVFEWYTQEQFLSFIEALDWHKEWVATQRELRQLHQRSRAAVIAQELASLDAQPQLSADQLQRQNELLQQLTQLRQTQPVK